MDNEDEEARMAHTHEFNLFENGIDFIRSGIETFFLEDTPDPRAHKYAVLHLFSGVQLLLKELLRREHSSLIFERVENAAAKDARTITFEQSVQRLKACAGIEIPAKTLKRLRTAQRIRNSLEHYKLDLNLPQTQKLIGQLAEFSYEFMQDHLHEALQGHLPARAWQRIQNLRTIADKLEEEEVRLRKERLRHYEHLSASDRAKLEAKSVYHPRDNPDSAELFLCPECSEETLVVAEEEIAVCTNAKCKAVVEFTSCFRCGNPAWDGGPYCESCDDYIEWQ